jgi:hypothetical protein
MSVPRIAVPVFDYRFQVPATVDAVADFHFQTGILKSLSPPLMLLQVHRFDPLAEGSIGDFTMWMGPVPVHWRAEHKNVSRAGFTDVQVAGPMKRWEHTHRFTAIDANTSEVHEHIEFEHHTGWRGIWSRMLFPKPALLALFFWRSLVTRRAAAKIDRAARAARSASREY